MTGPIPGAAVTHRMVPCCPLAASEQTMEPLKSDQAIDAAEFSHPPILFPIRSFRSNRPHILGRVNAVSYRQRISIRRPTQAANQRPPPRLTRHRLALRAEGSLAGCSASCGQRRRKPASKGTVSIAWRRSMSTKTALLDLTSIARARLAARPRKSDPVPCAMRGWGECSPASAWARSSSFSDRRGRPCADRRDEGGAAPSWRGASRHGLDV